MSRVESFPPLALPDARLLILGSMPGVASLEAGQYYAHRQNLFWRFLGAALDFKSDAPYPERCAALLAARIALWDVLASCHRPGSLDADIAPDSIAHNDLAGFFAAHPSIRRICFNGSLAEKQFLRHVRPTLAEPERLELVRLPSTSPANASIPLAEKQHAWAEAIGAPAMPTTPRLTER